MLVVKDHHSVNTKRKRAEIDKKRMLKLFSLRMTRVLGFMERQKKTVTKTLRIERSLILILLVTMTISILISTWTHRRKMTISIIRRWSPVIIKRIFLLKLSVLERQNRGRKL